MQKVTELEGDLSVRAAWLSLAGGLTQERIADRLGVSRVKVARLIARAQREGRIKVFVEGPVTSCLALEDRLVERFGLTGCRVVPSVADTPMPLDVLAPAGARLLQQVMERDDVKLIGMGHGRTLAAAVQAMPEINRPDLTFVSLLGSFTRSAATHPFDVIARLANRTGGEGYFMPAPFRCDSAEDKRLFLGQRSLREVFEMAESAPVMVLGVGAVERDTHMIETGMITAEEHRAVLKAGACGEILGTFLGADGAPVAADVNARSVAIGLKALKGKETIAIAGGHGKARALRAALRTGLIRSLVTDEATALRVLESEA